MPFKTSSSLHFHLYCFFSKYFNTRKSVIVLYEVVVKSSKLENGISFSFVASTDLNGKNCEWHLNIFFRHSFYLSCTIRSLVNTKLFQDYKFGQLGRKSHREERMKLDQTDR